MSEQIHTHAPREAFRSMLEEEVVRTLHRESRFAADRRVVSLRRLRAASLVFAGLLMGFTTEFASGQVQDSRERNRLLMAAQAEYAAAALRLRLAEEEAGQVRKMRDIGVATADAIRAAEAQVRQARLRIARLQLNSDEIQASSAPPRDELWAPRVGDRDYVSERLKVEAASIQERLRLLEERLDEVERGHRIGVIATAAVADARAQVDDAKMDLQLLGAKLTLRNRYLDERLSSEDVARQLNQVELTNEVQRVMRAMQLAQERVSAARERAAVGAASALDVARAEVEMMELSLKLRQLELQLQEARAIRKED